MFSIAEEKKYDFTPPKNPEVFSLIKGNLPYVSEVHRY
jgi:hypothetical protein